MALLDKFCPQGTGIGADTDAQRSRFAEGLERTKEIFRSLVSGGGSLDERVYEELTEELVAADVGIQVAESLVESVREEATRKGANDLDDLRSILAGRMVELFGELESPAPLEPGKLNVVLLVGVNGTGKTTFAAKLAHRLQSCDASVMFCAADTFRAAAIEQLEEWAGRIDVPVIKGEYKADPASVVYDAVQSAATKDSDVLIIDTAGRLQTKGNLMEELEKIHGSVHKSAPDAELRTLLTVDATAGQNVIDQVELFSEVAPLDGIVINKLDGTARGGVIFPAARLHEVPVEFIGVGEELEDLAEFDARNFVGELLGLEQPAGG